MAWSGWEEKEGDENVHDNIQNPESKEIQDQRVVILHKTVVIYWIKNLLI